MRPSRTLKGTTPSLPAARRRSDLRRRGNAVNGRSHPVTPMVKAATGVVVGIVVPVIERVVGPVGPEERVIRPFPVVPGAHQCEVRRPGPPRVRVGSDHEAPAAAVDVQDGVRAVVVVALAGVAEVGRVADEVVAAVLETKEAQIEGRIAVHVPAGGAVPRDTRLDPAVDGVRALETVASPLRLDGRTVDVGRNRRGRAFVLGCGRRRIVGWHGLRRTILRGHGALGSPGAVFLLRPCAASRQCWQGGGEQYCHRKSCARHFHPLLKFVLHRYRSKTGANLKRWQPLVFP